MGRETGTKGDRIPEAVGQELEQAIRTYEAALAELLDGGRHTRLDKEPDLHELRLQVIRQAEALPSMCWTRAKCDHCRGEREVPAMHAQYTDTASAPSFVPTRRLCPRCWGTGLTLNLQPPADNQERTRGHVTWSGDHLKRSLGLVWK
ncbi:hypothetical protein ACH347_39400 [Saccharopolyspora sp. 5N102]|uniref:hypothetical protein n=1 Tax=Saccharopolyspora sp. 5N102 TaxID=3375155 RepID=UPI00379A6BBE